MLSKRAPKRKKRDVSANVAEAVKQLKFPTSWNRWVSYAFVANNVAAAAVHYMIYNDNIPIDFGPEGEMPGRKGVWKHITARLVLQHNSFALSLPGTPFNVSREAQTTYMVVCLIHLKNGGAFDVTKFFDTIGLLPDVNQFQTPYYTLLKRWDVVLTAQLEVSEWTTVAGLTSPAALYYKMGSGSAKLLEFDEDVELPFTLADNGDIESGNLYIILLGEGYSLCHSSTVIKYAPAAF